MTTTSGSGMTTERAKEIALMYVKAMMKRNGIRGNMMRDIGNEAKDIGISTDEARAFVEFLLPEILGDIFGYHRTSVVFGDRRKTFQIHKD